jgi:branched-chain amino acid transport system substrate-binding protein
VHVLWKRSEWGEEELRVTQMLIDEVNESGGIGGEKLQLISEDTRSSNEGTVSAVSKLINIDKVPVIIGPTWGDSFQGAFPIAEQEQIVMISPSTSLEVAKETNNFQYLFSTFWSARTELSALQGYMAAHKNVNVAVINDLDSYDKKMSDIFIEIAAKNHLNVIERYELPIGTSDFRTTLTKLASSHVDAIFVVLQDPALLGPLLKQKSELKVSGPTYSMNSTQNQDLLDKFSGYLENIYFSYPKSLTDQAYKQAVQKYREKYQALPNTPSFVNAYNAVQALLQVLKDGARTGPEIREGLLRVQIAGIGSPTVSFNEIGQAQNTAFEIRTVKDNSFVVAPQ